MKSDTLYKVIAGLLVAIAVVLVLGRLLTGTAQLVAGVAASSCSA